MQHATSFVYFLYSHPSYLAAHLPLAGAPAAAAVAAHFVAVVLTVDHWSASI